MNETLSKNISRWIAKHRDDIVGLTADLIRHDTVNLVTDGRERECQEQIAAVLGGLGLETALYSPEEAPGFREHPAYFPGKDYAQRPNVAGRWKGGGGGKSLLFSSHADTAVVAPGWSGSPWEPREQNGKLYGLGSFDMKGGLAASIMAIRCLKELGIQPAGDVTVESVVDEEFGGANGTLAGRLMGYNADAAIIPEPTNMAICPATRGGALWRLTFRGKTGLSFSGETLVNPLYDTGKFLVFLEKFEKMRSGASGPAPWYADDASGLPVIVTRAEAGDMTAALCDVGPEQSDIDIWVECYPGVSEEQLKRELTDGYAAMFPEGQMPEFRKMIRFLPGSELMPDFPLIGLLGREVADVCGHEPQVRGAPFACDAFMFNLHSPTPAIVLGPSGAKAHAADEYVDIESLLRLTEVYARTIVRWCGVSSLHEGE
ncbi:M20/M25/M40 family metallo-hydrolase [Paenibacillus ginsengarvi]|uniref:M20/M25/M40 family metallo-hydrolase n=1 Tax=Paenibacillus ginsengarvi TaxID=400777 RepID=A0A3B0CIX3_9BACL|nr:M20/M25/M40 family metallo-hydrolase [Paenibacillus ginsengarvi]RKN84259.1 M20/M25/M40 family metallo-hydrolase [Paenibacillus ginsengarvi]